MMQRKIIRADGTEEMLGGPMTIQALREAIGADAVDFVELRHLGPPLHVMAVDDNAWDCRVESSGNRINVIPVSPLRPINAKATELYHANCVPGTTHQIAGDVAIVPDSDFA